MDTSDKKPDINDLSRWFSVARMARYADAADPAALYAWDVRLQKAFLEDVEHVEVLLRNFMAERLAADCLRRTSAEGPDKADRRWYDHAGTYNFNDRFEDSVRRAKRRLSHEGAPTDYDHVVAALSLDTWRFLLVRRLEPTVWRALRDRRNGGMPHYPGTSREDFESHVATIYHLRNRCSHQEHLVLADADEERRQLDQYADALRWVAERIDPEAAKWIATVSRVEGLRAERPVEKSGGTAEADCRVQFREMLQHNVKGGGSGSFGAEMASFSLSVAPPMLYRYRTCNERNLYQLENGELAFSRPSTFHDDPDDAYVPFSPEHIDQMNEWACGPLFEWFCKFIRMTPEERSVEISSQFPELKVTADLFKGVTAPWLNMQLAGFDGLSEEEKKAAITRAFHDMESSVSATDACNALRRSTMVACLCENPESDRMWDEYAGGSTGFQIGYSRQALFDMRALGNGGPLPYVLPVLYEDSRPPLAEAAVTIALEDLGLRLPVDHPLSKHQLVCTFIALYVKSRRLFSHEQEWRVTMFDQTANEAMLDYTSRKCPCSFVRLGRHTSADDETRIRKIGQTLNVPVFAYGEELPSLG